MDQRNELIDFTIEQRNQTQALVIGVCSRRPKLRRLLKELFSGLGHTNSTGGVVPTFASADPGADYIIADLRGAKPAETAFNTWLARPHILILDEAEVDALDGMETGGIVICSKDNEQFGEIEEAAREAGCAALFTVGEGSECSARMCESLEACNGTRAVFEILGEKVSLKVSASGKDLTTILYGLLAAGICGYQCGRSAEALMETIRSQPWGSAGGNLALFEASKRGVHERQEAAFRVLAMVDPGRGRRRMAFLSSMESRNSGCGRLALPVKTANLDLVYTGNDFCSKGNGGTGAGEIVTDVLSPGDILKVRQAFGKGMGIMIEALRTFPEHMMRGQEAEYAL